MSAGDVRVYDADQCVMIFGDVEIDGWAADDFFAIEGEADAFTDEVGVDGEITRSKTNDNRATVTVSTMQSSASNAKLSAIHNRDKNTPGGAGITNFRFKDMGGETEISAAQAWIMKAPDSTFGRGPNERNWRIRLAKAERTDGGN